MASTKTVTVLMNNVTLTAAAGDTTSDVGDLQDGYGAGLNIKITNGATGPTVAAQFQVEVSPDNSNWYSLVGRTSSDTGNNVITSWGGIPIPIDTKYVKVLAGSNTAQDVTIRVEMVEVVALA